MGKRVSAAFATAALLLAAAAPQAHAAEPLKIREVFPGSTTHGAGTEFVELQMSADGQAAIEGQELRFYNSSAALTATYVVGDDSAIVGQSQRTVLLATAQAASLGGAAAAPDFILPAGDRIAPGGGAVCFTGTGGGPPADCVVWGTFPPPPGIFDPQLIPDPQSAYAPLIANGFSLHRGISRGCATYLDSPDDSASSSADFAQTTPSPRHNATSSPHGEVRCPPTATISTGPVVPFANPNNATTADFTYTTVEAEPGVAFQCHLDFSPTQTPPAIPPGEGEWSLCTSQPQNYSGLPDGFHRFWVRAVGENPAPGPPVSRSWQLDATAPETTIDTVPPQPSSGFEAAFAFSSSEPQSSFRCQLDGGAIQVCGNNASSGARSYFDLPDGPHTFSVYATDNAGNPDPTPATASFTVLRLLGDLTPPDTTVTGSPPNPSPSATAAFTYSATEQGSSFECRLGSAPFAPCPASGQSYGPLKNATYTFEVRATDRAANVDSVPAAYSWSVKAPLPKTRFAKAPAGTVRTKGKTARLSFLLKADKPGSTFRCRLDRAKFKPCKARLALTASLGRHRFEAYAIDSLGNAETTPARRIVRVRERSGGGFF